MIPVIVDLGRNIRGVTIQIRFLLMHKELTKEWVAKKLPKRPKDANKGTFGKVLVIAGSENYPGAAYLACVACYRVGVGLVTLATTSFVKQIVAKKLPEVTFLSFDEIFKKLFDYNVLLLGPGLGQNEEGVKFIKKLLEQKLPKLVLDADGLNTLSGLENWWDKLKTDAVLTPHPGEMARLTNLSIDEIQSNRVDTAKHFARIWNQVVVLKGANTIVCSLDGRVKISPFANPTLATAGTGDVLSGIIAGFLAQGLNTFDAACLGVYIHGLVGEKVRKKLGDAGAIASDLLPLLPKMIKSLIYISKHRIS